MKSHSTLYPCQNHQSQQSNKSFHTHSINKHPTQNIKDVKYPPVAVCFMLSSVAEVSVASQEAASFPRSAPASAAILAASLAIHSLVPPQNSAATRSSQAKSAEAKATSRGKNDEGRWEPRWTPAKKMRCHKGFADLPAWPASRNESRRTRRDSGRKCSVAFGDLRCVFFPFLHHSHVDNVTHIEVAAVIEE